MRKRKSHKKAIPSTGIEPKENIFEYSTKRPKRKETKRKADRMEKREILKSDSKWPQGPIFLQEFRKKRQTKLKIRRDKKRQKDLDKFHQGKTPASANDPVSWREEDIGF